MPGRVFVGLNGVIVDALAIRSQSAGQALARHVSADGSTCSETCSVSLATCERLEESCVIACFCQRLELVRTQDMLVLVLAFGTSLMHIGSAAFPEIGVYLVLMFLFSTYLCTL